MVFSLNMQLSFVFLVRYKTKTSRFFKTYLPHHTSFYEYLENDIFLLGSQGNFLNKKPEDNPLVLRGKSPPPPARSLVYILLMTNQVIITDLTCLVVFALNLRPPSQWRAWI